MNATTELAEKLAEAIGAEIIEVRKVFEDPTKVTAAQWHNAEERLNSLEKCEKTLKRLVSFKFGKKHFGFGGNQ